ncbi:MAG TPA: ABC transporter ATP-binding protein [Patescibacteria group bacterium]|nr:ABC transporter ATP-binding protein [Patescibacteria group bacterium]
MNNTKYILQALGVKKSFGITPALQGASLQIKKGEIVAIMGPSGSGKSTLLHCLAGIFTPDEGQVLLGDTRLDRLDETKRTKLRRTDFGFVFQFGQLVPELGAADNIALPLLFNKVSRKEAYKQASIWLQRLGMSELANRRSGELSGGQTQRVAIARALATHPQVLFADEPTGALDSLTSEKVMDLLIDIVREEGVTVIIVTHDARIASYADRQVIVRDGKVTTGKHLGGVER